MLPRRSCQTNCFGEQLAAPAHGDDGGGDSGAPPLLLTLAGGIELRGREGELDVSLTADASDSSTWRRVLLRRTWVDGECRSAVEVT